MVEMIKKEYGNYLLNIFETKDEIYSFLSNEIINNILETLNNKNRFQLCLCGGSTPKKLYDRLSKELIPWNKVDIFLGDERCVGPDSNDSNSLMVKSHLLKNFGSKAYFYQIFNNSEIDEDYSKRLFISELKSKCMGNPPRFDLTLLGLGDDGHTASLFPFKKNNKEDDFVIFSEGNGMRRLSLTPKILSASSKIIFLISGTSKHIALSRLIDGNENSERTPAKLITSKKKISVFCDLPSTKSLSI